MNLAFVRSDGLSRRGSEVVFPFDMANLLKEAGFHLGFVKLVGRWEVAEPGAEPGAWTVLAGSTLDYEVPVLEDHFEKPRVCVSVEHENDEYRLVISDSCGSSRASGAAPE